MESQAKSAQKWSQSNYNVFQKYRGQWVAYNAEEGVIANSKDFEIVNQTAKQSGKWFVLKYVNPITYAGLRRLASVHFRPLHMDTWVPNVVVIVGFKGKTAPLEMLVDSGADISTVPYHIGLTMGFERFEGEVPDMAAGVTGSISYVLRVVDMEIEGHVFKAPVAWFLDAQSEDVLLGREVVFDQFDIEFRQREGEILFKRHAD